MNAFRVTARCGTAVTLAGALLSLVTGALGYSGAVSGPNSPTTVCGTSTVAAQPYSAIELFGYWALVFLMFVVCIALVATTIIAAYATYCAATGKEFDLRFSTKP